jgi:hypothetical protein
MWPRILSAAELELDADFVLPAILKYCPTLSRSAVGLMTIKLGKMSGNSRRKFGRDEG